MAKFNILIAGAGVAGPSLAYWLCRYGMKVTVVERFAQLRTAGQTIDIRGAGREVIRKMDLDQTIRSRTTKEAGLKFVDRHNKTRASFSVEGSNGNGFVSEIEILRGELTTIFYDKSVEVGAEYRFNDHITTLKDHGDGVTVDFASSQSREFDLVIGADGQGSKTRRMVFPEYDRPSFLGQYTSYFTIPFEDSDGTWARWYNAPEGRCCLLRPDNLGTTRAFLSIMKEPTGWEKMSVSDQKKALHEQFADAGWEVPRVLAAMDSADDFYLQQIAQVKMEKWSKGRIGLLGDAAYCASPISGMGTSLAIVGAYVLAGELSKNATHEEAFRAYEKVLRPYVAKAQKLFPGAPGIANPKTQLGINVLNGVAGLSSLVADTWLAKWLGTLGPPAGSIELPMYEKDSE